MEKKILIVGGCKGGVGKSIVASALIDYLASTREEKVYLIESDTSNPDVGKAYFKPINGIARVPGEALDLDDAEGWISLVNAADQNPDAHVVVNTAARNNKGVVSYGNLLAESLKDLKRDVVTFWVINRQKDSLELCRSYLDAVPFGTFHIVINGYFGERKKFQLYDDSKIREDVEEKGKSLYFPDLADRVSDMMRNNRLSVAEAEETLAIGERAELRRWRNEYKKMFAAAETDAVIGEQRPRHRREGEKALLSSFESLLGRQITDKEKMHLLRVKDALGLRDNDALWLILMSLEEYAYRFDQIPEKVQKDTAMLVEAHKKMLEAEAANAAQTAQEKIVEALTNRVEASISQATQTKYFVSLGWTVIALVLLSVATFTAGVIMGSGKIPWWTLPASRLTPLEILLSSILTAPAGWVFSLLAVPSTGYYLYNFSFEGLSKKERGVKFLRAALCVLATLSLLCGTFLFMF